LNKIKSLLKDLGLEKEEIIFLSETVSFKLNNEKYITSILENKYNKIKSFKDYFSRDVLSLKGVYLDFVIVEIMAELYKDKEKTLMKYEKMLEENNEEYFFKEISFSCVVEDLAERFYNKLVKNKAYLVKLQLIHSNKIIRYIQDIIIEEEDIIIKEDKNLFKRNMIFNVLDFLEIVESQLNPNYKRTLLTSLDIKFNNELNFKENLYLNISEEKISSFLNKEIELEDKEIANVFKLESNFLDKITFESSENFSDKEIKKITTDEKINGINVYSFNPRPLMAYNFKGKKIFNFDIQEEYQMDL
jgi:hypothetical protein